MTELVKVEREGGIATVIPNRPRKLNVLTQPMRHARPFPLFSVKCSSC